ncbi:unnamed protein product [Cladocopium goreaui]|uniref:Serine/threonine-protein kinase prp4 n=1 Tax=Cladocopium goreaui TaxID=2562237 RepID=A0A9P1DLY8_9DINO|nr:unnamed protein product [Cladocopium goreaui]
MQKLEPGEGWSSHRPQGIDESTKKRRSNFSDALPAAGPLPPEDEHAELRLGCFEITGKKRPRPQSLNLVKSITPNAVHEQAPLAEAKTFEIGGGSASQPFPADNSELSKQPRTLEVAAKRTKQQRPPSQSPAEAQASQAAKDNGMNHNATLDPESQEQSERREREYFKPYIGEPCGPENRFLVEAPLGRGSFSSVFRCSDTKGRGKEYAVKFIRDNPGLRKATEAEVRLMRRIRTKAVEKDSEGANCLLGLASLETFMHHGHLALIFHLQRYDLRTALRRGGRGFPLQDLERYASDLFLALRALRAIRIIHTDIKPDNLLMSLDKKSVKLSDFGCAVDTQDEVQIKHIRRAYISSYRAPEIILGQSYSTRVDMWSAGATLFELAHGQVLFGEDSNNKLLYDMLNTCGPFKKAFATAGKNALKHFNLEGDFKRKRTDGNEQLLPMRRFAKPLTPLLGRLQQKLQDVKLKDFAGLLGQCLVPEAIDRLAPEEALQHGFLRNSQ